VFRIVLMLTILCFPFMLFRRYASFLRLAPILVSLTIHVLLSGSSAAKDRSTPSLLYPWITDCAKRGRASQNGSLAEEGTIIDVLLSCMLESSVTDGFSHDELTVRSTNLDWCFPPSFLSVSSTCQSEGFDPYKFLFPCLGLDGMPKLDKIKFHYELPSNLNIQNTTAGPNGNDTVIVIDSLIGTLCSFLDTIRAPAGVICLTDVCQTVSGSPSTMPSDQPSVFPSDHPSMTPSIVPSNRPSQLPTERTMVPTRLAPGILSEAVLSDGPVPAPTKQPISIETLPSLAVQIEILIRFVIRGVHTASQQSESFRETLKDSLDLTFAAKVRGHKSVDIVMLNQTTPTTVETVILTIGRRECKQCSASWVSNLIISNYLDELRNADVSGGLTRQIEFQAFIGDVQSLLNITIDSESVELLAPSNRTGNGSRSQISETSSAVSWAFLRSGAFTIVLSLFISSFFGN
jgi:hypothetical protein